MDSETSGTNDSATKENTDAYDWVNQVTKGIGDLTELVKDSFAKNETRFAEIEKALAPKEDSEKGAGGPAKEEVTKENVAKTKKAKKSKKADVEINTDNDDEEEDEDKEKEGMKSFPKKTKKSNEEISELKTQLEVMAKSIEELKSSFIKKEEEEKEPPAPVEDTSSVVKKNLNTTETSAPATGLRGAAPRELTPEEYAKRVVNQYPNPEKFGEAAGYNALVNRFRAKADQIEKLQPKFN